MKTIQFILLALFLSASLAIAQENLYVSKGGKVVYHSTVSTVDSITFQLPAGAVADFDGNVYNSVTIGTQTWMVENLKTTHYRDGSPISNIIDNAAWRDAYAGLTGAWCDYDNNAANGNMYGHLYNWYAVADARNIAPVGWHVPSVAEWMTLYNYLGANGGGALKETGTLNWTSENIGATNSTGFTALPGGYRGAADGVCLGLNTSAQFWTSIGNAQGDYLGTYFYLVNNNAELAGVSNFVTFGLSVRCIKD